MRIFHCCLFGAILTYLQLSDFEDQVMRHPHLSGLELKQRTISLRPQQEIIAEGEAKERSALSKQQTNGVPSPTAPLLNGIYTTPPLQMGIFGNGGPRY